MGRMFDIPTEVITNCYPHIIESIDLKPMQKFINTVGYHELLIEAIGNTNYKQKTTMNPMDFPDSIDFLNIFVEEQFKNFKQQLCREAEYDTFMINIRLDGDVVWNGMWSNDSI